MGYTERTKKLWRVRYSFIAAVDGLTGFLEAINAVIKDVEV